MPDEAPPVHLPSPSYWPIVLALGVLLIAAGIIVNLIISLIGAVVLLAAIVGWTQENRVADPEAGEHD
jgi:cytochrome c oxidase subunit 1